MVKLVTERQDQHLLDEDEATEGDKHDRTDAPNQRCVLALLVQVQRHPDPEYVLPPDQPLKLPPGRDFVFHLSKLIL